MSFWGYRPYVPVAQRRANVASKVAKLGKKKGFTPDPVQPEGKRAIATSFWGKAWCDHMEGFSDFSNRLPRGRTYIRNGSVLHLEISPGLIHAMVAGSELYKVNISIQPLPAKDWTQIKEKCSGSIGSLVELLQGRLSDSVMSVVTDPQTGLFPRPGQMKLDCSCPDWATMCKHVAATLYGAAVRLDRSPELLFSLRGVDSQELVDASAAVQSVTSRAAGGARTRRLASANLGRVFGIELGDHEQAKSDNSPKKDEVKKTAKIDELPSKKKRGRPPKSSKASGNNASAKHLPGMPDALTGSQLKKFRLSLDMTQAQFAKAAKVSVPSIVRWEQAGKNALSLNQPSRRKLETAWMKNG